MAARRATKHGPEERLDRYRSKRDFRVTPEPAGARSGRTNDEVAAGYSLDDTRTWVEQGTVPEALAWPVPPISHDTETPPIRRGRPTAGRHSLGCGRTIAEARPRRSHRSLIEILETAS